MIRRQADLTGIQKLAGHDLARRDLQVGRARDDGGRLPAQLQGYRYQVLGRRTHHMLANTAGPGEQQVVERQAAERLADLRATGHDSDLVFGEGGAEHPLHQLGTRRVQLRNFDHRPVAG
ncbi:hypothetical protein D3C77_492150 [compost metagenome]